MPKIPLGSDNVWYRNFADCKVSPPSGVEGDRGEGSSIHPRRLCATCNQPLTKRWQKLCCSKSCAAKRTPVRNQAGAANGNYKGGISQNKARYAKRFAARHPEKLKAHLAVAYALIRRVLERPTFCESCYVDCRPAAHHWDYSKPLQVEWLCRKCHDAADRIRRARERAMGRAS